jgi:hypothetical protein
VNVYVTVLQPTFVMGSQLLDRASRVNTPAVPVCVPATVVLTSNPGNSMDVVPAATGRLFVSVTLTASPSLTIRVGPGICITPQLLAFIAPGA